MQIPSFSSQTKLVDQSVLVGVCVTAGEVVYIYGYPFDLHAIGRLYNLDKLNVI